VVERVLWFVVGLSVLEIWGIFFSDMVFILLCGWLGNVYLPDC
jgi:hypothetical protein